MTDAKLRLGGMALRNGLLVHGPNHWAVAIRNESGAIEVTSGAKPRFRGQAARLPGLHGVLRLGEAFALIPMIKQSVPKAQLPFEDARMVAAMVGATALAAGVRKSGPRTFARESAVAFLSVAPTALALKDSGLAAYHG